MVIRLSVGDFTVCGRGAPPRRGAKRIDNLRFSILLGLQLSLIGQSGADHRPATASKSGNGSRVTTTCLSPPFRSSQIAYCYTDRQLYAGATYPCRANPWHVVTHSTCEAIWFVPFILVGAVRNLQTYESCGTVMPHPAQTKRLCSSTVSDTAKRYKKRTDPKLVRP